MSCQLALSYHIKHLTGLIDYFDHDSGVAINMIYDLRVPTPNGDTIPASS